MRAVVVYESMYGNTHLVADAVADGLREQMEVTVVPVGGATADVLRGSDLLLVGGPTHVHGMSRESTRTAAVDAAGKEGSDLELDPDAEGPGLREWFDEVGELPARAVAFDTRIDARAAFTGRAAKGIAKRLRRHGCDLIAAPESFLVTKASHLEPDEIEHARRWARSLASQLIDA